MNCNELIGSIWVTGLSSAGKSTLANLLGRRLWENGFPNILLDGDRIRNVFEEKLGYDSESRKKQTARVMRLAQWVSSQGILPIVAIIHPFEEDRIRCRNSLKGYFEVYLKCDLDVCMKRDSRNVYSQALSGEAKNVVGLDIPYEPPRNPDLVLESDKFSPEEMLEILENQIQKRLFSKVTVNKQ